MPLQFQVTELHQTFTVNKYNQILKLLKNSHLPNLDNLITLDSPA